MMKHRAHPQAGLSLVELMVSMVIGLMLVTGLVTLVGNSNQNFQELTRTSQQLENGRYAWQVLRDEMRLAGFYGELFAIPDPGAALPDPCAVNDVATQTAGLPFPLQGYDAPAATPLSCIAAADFSTGTDVLVVRRASTDTTQRAGLLHIQSTPRGYTLAALPDADDPEAPALDSVFNQTWLAYNPANPISATNFPPPIRPYFVYIYFISPYSTTADDGIPTLKRVEVGAAATSVVSLVEGVENMQVAYGLDTNDDGSPDSYVTDTTAMTVTDWSNVVAAQVHLLMRNLEPTAGYNDTKTYDLGGTLVEEPGDSYKRHVYTAAVRLTNPAGRRE